MQIGKKDVIWSYSATFLKLVSSALLIPLILRTMSPENVAIWSLFVTITSFASLLDFGFNPSFTRNVSYVFSGVRKLKVNGFETSPFRNEGVDYGLLRALISAMRWVYLRISLVLFLMLATFGTYYLSVILKNYHGNQQEVYVAWALLCVINAYNLFSLYYDSLLQGKGLIKRAKQFAIIGQLAYLIVAATLILFGYGLIAIVSAQLASVLLVRWLSYRCFFTPDIKRILLHGEKHHSAKEILQVIYPNALKIGLTSMGGFLVQRSAIIIGSLYLPLTEIASYGLSMQFVSIVSGLSGIYTLTFEPKISQLRVMGNSAAIKGIYIRGQGILFLTFLLGGATLVSCGSQVLSLIGSKTNLMPLSLMTLAIFLSFVETNLSIAGSILVTKNEVPFFKASLLSGVAIVVFLLVAFNFLHLGLLTMILVPLIVDLLYQAWKWPLEVAKELNLYTKKIFVTKYY